MRKEAPTGFQKGYLVPPKMRKVKGFEGSTVNHTKLWVGLLSVGWSGVERGEGFQPGSGVIGRGQVGVGRTA